MSQVVDIDKNKWGPIAWNLIHNFSIKSKNNDCMYILIKTFGYLLPCPVCRKHYNYLINDIYKLEKENCTKDYMIKYLYEIHNIINENLDKKIKISFKKCKELHKKTYNSDIIFFIVMIYSSINYKKISFNEFDKIYNFFICFLKIYPNNKINQNFKKILKNKKFIDSDTPLTFSKWFHEYFKELDYIKKYYVKGKKNILILFKE